MTSSKANYDLNPLEDLPPPSYAEATTNTAQSTSSDKCPTAASGQSLRSNSAVPSMEVAGARASMAAAQDASNSRAMNREYSSQQGLGPNSDPRIGGMGGSGPGSGFGGRFSGPPGERFDYPQRTQQANDRFGPEQRYGSGGMYYRNDYAGTRNVRGPQYGGVGILERGGGLFGRVGGAMLGVEGGPRERRYERRCARREGRWERRGL